MASSGPPNGNDDGVVHPAGAQAAPESVILASNLGSVLIVENSSLNESFVVVPQEEAAPSRDQVPQREAARPNNNALAPQLVDIHSSGLISGIADNPSFQLANLDSVLDAEPSNQAPANVDPPAQEAVPEPVVAPQVLQNEADAANAVLSSVIEPNAPENLSQISGLLSGIELAGLTIGGNSGDRLSRVMEPQQQDAEPSRILRNIPEGEAVEEFKAPEVPEEEPPAPVIVEEDPVLDDDIYGKLIVLGINGAHGSPNELLLRRRAVANGLTEVKRVPKKREPASNTPQAQIHQPHEHSAFDTGFGRMNMAKAKHEVNLNHPDPEAERQRLERIGAVSSIVPVNRMFDLSIHRAGEEEEEHHSQILFRVAPNKTESVQFQMDPKIDMFQIGRAQSDRIDLRIDQKFPESDGSSMVSRYSCRISVERAYPHRARLYAAGFDDSFRIFLGEIARVWRLPNGHVDGLTTNGVLLCKNPEKASQSLLLTEHWREVSVRGNIYPYKASRQVSEFELIQSEDNVLTDGCLIDLAGVVLMYRDRVGMTQLLKNGKAKIDELKSNLAGITDNAICPVMYHPLILRPTEGAPPQPGDVLHSSVMPVNLRELARNLAAGEEEGGERSAVVPASGTGAVPISQLPFLYVVCGHVTSNIDWGQTEGYGAHGPEYQCPLCRQAGPRLRLRVGSEPCFWRDLHPVVTHAFTKCAHGVSKETAEFWSKIKMPRDGDPICPFCGTRVEGKKFVELRFETRQEGVDVLPPPSEDDNDVPMRPHNDENENDMDAE